MKPTITKNGKVLSARMDAPCRSTGGEMRSISLSLNADRLNVCTSGGKFGLDLSREDACDLGSQLIHFGKTGTLEEGE